MKQNPIYNSKNIFALLFAFGIIFGLLHYLATTLHQTQKINAEIDAIRVENRKLYTDIEKKNQKLLYLKTPQRIDKDAKTQIGKRQVNEKSITFIAPEKDFEISGKTKALDITAPLIINQLESHDHLQKWYELFFETKVTLTTLRKQQESTR